jgi:hypothetical protein
LPCLRKLFTLVDIVPFSRFEENRMNRKLLFVAAAIFAASMSGSVLAADPGQDAKVAKKEYDTAIAKAKSDYKAATAKCKQLAQEKQSACTKEAKAARTQARSVAHENYTRATGNTKPATGA